MSAGLVVSENSGTVVKLLNFSSLSFLFCKVGILLLPHSGVVRIMNYCA